MEAAAQGQLFDYPVIAERKRSTLRQMLDAIDEHGSLCPQSLIHGFLELSHQRVSQLCADGRFTVIRIGKINFVPFAEINVFMTEERKSGRPCKIPDTFSDFRKQLKRNR